MHRLLWLSPLALVVACGVSNHGTAPSTVPEPAPAPAPPALSTLRGDWIRGTDVVGAQLPAGSNAVVVLPSYADDQPGEIARELQARRLAAVVFAGHIFHGDPSRWDADWSYFESRYLAPLRAAGVLVGAQPVDEPAHNGLSVERVEAACRYVHARGLRTLTTEAVRYVDDGSSGPGYRRPRPATDWYAVTCYDDPGTVYTVERCAELYARHPEWDVVAAQGFDAGRGLLWWRYPD